MFFGLLLSALFCLRITPRNDLHNCLYSNAYPPRETATVLI